MQKINELQFIYIIYKTKENKYLVSGQRPDPISDVKNIFSQIKNK